MAFAVLRCLMIGASLTSFAWSKAALSFDDTAAIAINPKHTAVYLAKGQATQLEVCRIDSSERLGPCQVTGPTSFVKPSRLSISADGRYLYLVDSVYHALYQCEIDPNSAQVIGCNEINPSFGDVSGVAADQANRFLYLSHSSGAVAVSRSQLTTQGDLGECRAEKLGLVHAQALALNQAASQAYILSSRAKAIWSCDIAKDSGQLYHCQSQSLAHKSLAQSSAGLRGLNSTRSSSCLGSAIPAVGRDDKNYEARCAISANGEMTFVNEYPDGSSYRCLITQNTADFQSCFRGGNPLAYAEPLNIYLSKDNRQIYLYSAGSLTMHCGLDDHGRILQCSLIQARAKSVKDLIQL